MTSGAEHDSSTPKRGPELRLAVVDMDDLEVISAHLQHAEAIAGEMAYLPKTKRFALVVDRICWVEAVAGRHIRCRTGLHFERVLKVSSLGIDLAARDARHHLLTISFREDDDPPSGQILLAFDGGGVIRLTVECLEAEMRDLGERWSAEDAEATVLDGASAKAL